MRIIVRIINKILRVLYSIKRHYINLRPTIQIGKGTIIEKGAIISTRYGGTITIGENCHISRYGHILSCGGNIIIGNNSTVNPFAMVVWSRRFKNRKWCSHCNSINNTSF